MHNLVFRQRNISAIHHTLEFVGIRAVQLSYFNRITPRWLVYPDRKGREERRPGAGRILKLKILAVRGGARSTIPLVRSPDLVRENVFFRALKHVT